MNAITANRLTAAPQPLLSTSTHITLAVIVAGVLALVLIAAGNASKDAVQTASTSFKQAAPATVFLEPVQIVGRRDGERKRS